VKIGICAGEPSGDLLGGGLIEALKRRYPDATFEGIAGDQMVKAGCRVIYPVSDLSVMGVAEVLPNLPRILKMQRHIIQHFLDNPPDIYIGIDAPDFNLPIEKKLKAAKIKTVHYVSPTVWAWRKNRIHGIKKAVDLMLCCFPFEMPIYEQAGIPVAFVGHSAFERLRNVPTMETVRPQFNLSMDRPVVAILPGSRGMEIRYLMPLFMETVKILHAKNPEIQFILPIAKPSLRDAINAINHEGIIKCVEGNAADVIQSADVVCVASGTATLETFVLRKPMVVAYKMHPFNAWLGKLLVKIDFCAIPNLLARRLMVPEFIQDTATPEALAQPLWNWLTNPSAIAALKAEYDTVRAPFEGDASERASEAIATLL
jgi:lipid-A-disaccharide synthase